MSGYSKNGGMQWVCEWCGKERFLSSWNGGAPRGWYDEHYCSRKCYEAANRSSSSDRSSSSGSKGGCLSTIIVIVIIIIAIAIFF